MELLIQQVSVGPRELAVPFSDNLAHLDMHPDLTALSRSPAIQSAWNSDHFTPTFLYTYLALTSAFLWAHHHLPIYSA